MWPRSEVGLFAGVYWVCDIAVFVCRAIGKQEARFNVDFRCPASPIQAFAICISNHGISDFRN